MRGWATLPLLLLTLAGCSQGDGATAALTSDAGVLHGVVVDQAIRPIVGAQVHIAGGGKTYNATSDDVGQFRLIDLTPGTYIVEVSKAFHSAHQQAVVVETGVKDPPIVQFQLVFEASSVPFAVVYKHEGYHECGANVVRVCSNVNIATWIVVCGQTGGAVCLGNVTSDRSLFFQNIDGPPTFLQAELSWDATTPAGTELSFLIGGGTADELKGGVALPAYNFTTGPSPLMVRVSNHEGPEAWCRNVPDPPCSERALEDSKLGVERVLLGQVDAGTTVKAAPCGQVDPCGVGWSQQQAFTLYTTVFYGYEPPLDWRFTEAGVVPAPPA